MQSFVKIMNNIHVVVISIPFEPGTVLWHRTVDSDCATRIKKSCPISVLQLGAEKIVCWKGDLGQRFLVEGWYEGDWWV